MTIKEIAQLCGVSRGTVDRVLNCRGHVNPQTEALILDTIRRQGYTKNMAGRALTVKRSEPVIGVIVCSEGNPFFDDVLAGVRQAREDLSDYGVTLDVRTMRGYEVDRQLSQIDSLRESVSALVVQPINDPRIEAALTALLAAGKPVVTLNSDIAPSCRCCYVGSDYETGGAAAAGLVRLVTGGSARLGVITGVDTLMGHVLRLKGFEERLRAACPGITVVARASAMDDPATAYAVTREMLSVHADIDALFVLAACASDVCRAVLDVGRSSIRVVAYDDVPSTREMMRRGVIRAVVCQQPFDQGFRAVRAAFDMILSGRLLCDRRIIMENQIKILENL